MNPKIDTYLIEGCGRCPLGGTYDCKVHKWTDELKKLRAIILECGLNEELKWGVPCYTYQNKNIAIVSAFKNYCALSFLKGSLLSDKEGILNSPGENSQASRLFKFTSIEKIIELESTIKKYIFEAIEIEKSGLKIEFNKNSQPLPNELQQKFTEDPVFKSAFENLTPGRQRGYILYFSQPKQSKTRVARIEKNMSKIFKGEGLNDHYKSMNNK